MLWVVVLLLLVMAAQTQAVSTTLVINEIDYDQPMTDTAEFVELKNVGTVNIDLDTYSVLMINGSGTTVYRTFDLPAVILAPGDYYVVCANAANVANCDLDVTPETDLIQNGAPDAVAVVQGTTVIDTVSYEGDTGAPYTETSGVGLLDDASAGTGISRCDDGVDTDVNNADFLLRTITPGTANDCPSVTPSPTPTPPPPTGPTLVVNEIDYDQPSTDAAEFVELKNITGASLNLDSFAVQLVNGNGGAVYGTFDLPNVELAAGDYYVVCANAATVANCDLDVAPDTNLLQNGPPDAVAVVQGATIIDTVSYEGNTAGYTEGSGAQEDPDGVAGSGLSRCPDGTDTNNNSADFLLAVITPGAASTCPPPPTAALIRDIQGAGHVSPVVNQRFITQGIVTAVRSNGFNIQDPNPDSNNATSEGILVFTNSAPTVAVGDAVSVTGTVAEFYPGGISANNLPTTELASPVVTVLSSGNALPAPIVIGAGGRVPPSAVIDDDVNGEVETSGTFDADTDGLDFYESLEGMRVQVNDALAVSPTNNFGEIAVVGDNGTLAASLTARGGIYIQPGDFNPERIILDDVLAPTPLVNVGDHFTSALVGVLDYSFGNFKLLVTATPTTVSGGLAPEVGPIFANGQLSLATFNVENLDPGDPADKFDGLADHIVINLHSPDIIGLEEIQDNNGPTNDAEVDASQTAATLIAAIQAAGGPVYEYRDITPVDDADGGEPGGNIRVAFLFRPDRVTFVDRGDADSLTPNSAVDGTDGVELAFSPGRIDPLNTAFDNSRKPLAGEFIFNGETVFVIVNHFNSKGGDTPLFGRWQPPRLISEMQRLQQAQVVNDFVDSILELDPDANIVVFGDLNDFPFSPPLAAVVEGGVLTNLVTTLPANEQYTYVFDGNSQVLDNFLVSDYLFGQFDEFDVVHINAEFNASTRRSDHDPSVGTFSIVRTVEIDIRPNSENNRINLRSHGNVPVAILSTADFDATTINPATVTFAGAPVDSRRNDEPRVTFRDVNDDGLQDIVLRFEIDDMTLTSFDTEATLTGQTFDGYALAGTDAVVVLPLLRVRGLEEDYPLFTWDETEGAACYQIQIDNQRSFNSPEQDATVVEATQYNADVLPPGRYYWRVRVGGTCVGVPQGEWAEGDRFRVE